ncbi:MAG: TIGR02300 family protein [Robiginitomaculum sp.]|nr:TIGR02300 family protein [Robiginitomaculum sp.]
MAKADLGDKRVCAECSAKFFDLKKRPVVCPKCGFSFDPDITRRQSRKAPPADEPKEEVEDEESDSETEGGDDQKELSLDDATIISTGSDDSDEGSDTAKASALPDGYSEEGVEDETDNLVDDEDEDAKLADEEDPNN